LSIKAVVIYIAVEYGIDITFFW